MEVRQQMQSKIINFVDFKKVNMLLEGFNQATGFVTAILDLEGNVLSQSGWRHICTDFHRVNSDTAQNCRVSDTVLANQMSNGEKYHSYKCLNGLVDVAVPIIIKGKHIANLFSGQFFFEDPDIAYFTKQAKQYGFDEIAYLKALEKVPVVSEEKVEDIMQYLINIIQMISELTLEKLEQITKEKRYRGLVDNLSAGVIVHGPDSQIILCNHRASELLGLTEDQMKGKKAIDPAWKFVKEDMTPLPLENYPISYILTYKRPLNNQVLGICQSNSKDVVWVTVNGVPLYNEEGILVEVVISFIDITESILAEKALEESEARHKAMVAGISDVIGIIDAKGIIAYKSPNIERLFGWKPEELVGESAFIAVHPEDLPWVSVEFNKVLTDNHASETIEYRYRCKDGSYKMVELTATNHLQDTYIQGILLNYKDITERQIAEKAISEEKERLAVTLRSIGDGVITTDIDGKVMIINRIAEELTGWKQSEAYGKPITTVFNIVNESTREAHINPVEKVIASGSIIELENHTVLISKDGRERVIADSGAPINDNESNIIGVVLVFRDMTEKQKLMENMQRIDKLDSLGILAGGIAHDFNNLLGGIFGYIDLARSSSDENDGVNKYLDKALTVFDRAKDLTQQLLTFSKGGVPKRETGHLGKFIEESALFVLSGTNISCELDVNKDLWLCDFVGNQIGQVIDNMLINAIQAMPQGGKVEMSARNRIIGEGEKPTIEAGKYIEIMIKDYGEGIDREVIKSIFDPFFSTKSKGNGLGLATCYSIVQKHDGYIDVESESGKGSTFYIYLPASISSALLNKKEVVSEHQGQGIVLVMDDEDFMREVLSKMLVSFGYTVIEAVNGEEILALSEGLRDEGKSIKCAIFDLTVPGGMGGKETLVEFSAMFPKVPVFASSGFSVDPTMSRPQDFGFTDSIQKPFGAKELAQILEKHKEKLCL